MHAGDVFAEWIRDESGEYQEYRICRLLTDAKFGITVECNRDCRDCLIPVIYRLERIESLLPHP